MGSAHQHGAHYFVDCLFRAPGFAEDRGDLFVRKVSVGQVYQQ